MCELSDCFISSRDKMRDCCRQKYLQDFAFSTTLSKGHEDVGDKKICYNCLATASLGGPRLPLHMKNISTGGQ
jgi:hypothetical protein